MKQDPHPANAAATHGAKRGSASGRSQASSPEVLENERTALLQRLQNLDPRAKSWPGYRTALSLLNSKFRKSTLGARMAVLQAATFMIEVLEKLPL